MTAVDWDALAASRDVRNTDELCECGWRLINEYGSLYCTNPRCDW